MDKVYCRKCCYFLEDIELGSSDGFDWCNHPNNMERVLDHEESYLSPATYKNKNIKNPSEIISLLKLNLTNNK